MLERSDVSHPLWRKKVDSTFLNEGSTPIPNWLVKLWGISDYYDNVRSKKSPESSTLVSFQNEVYEGKLVKVKRDKGFVFRIFLHAKHIDMLRQTFLMTYMRTLEGGISTNKNRRDIEVEIPFWEFIDIEFDNKKNHFFLVAHYVQKPFFPELFKRIGSSVLIKNIQDEILGKDKNRIQKLGWKPRTEYKSEINAENVIYTLVDTKNRLIYIGEAEKLAKRFDSGHPDILDWDFYKFNQLPPDLAEHRLKIERMDIRDMAALLENKNGIGTLGISDYKLANRKIDK
jgi:hypothetical protein